MAEIYTKGSDKTLIPNPREGRGREFDCGSDWTEIRIGVFISAVAATGPNNASVYELLAVSSVADNMTFGLKDSSANLPGEAGAMFIGMKQSGAFVEALGGNERIGNYGGPIGTAIGYNGASVVASTGGTNYFGWSEGTNVTGAAPYATFSGIQFVITNRGLATQSVQIKTGALAGISDYSADSLRTQLNNFNWGATVAMNLAWNNGVTAYAIPSCVWIRCPLFFNKIRISAIRVIRYAP